MAKKYNASVLKVKDAEGKNVNIPAIKGEPGKDYVLTDADKQEIADLVGGGSGGGGSGSDGFSPIIEIEAITGGHRVTITDVEGEKSFDVLNGVDGKNYVLTEADKTDIANTVVDLLPKYNGEVADV